MTVREITENLEPQILLMKRRNRHHPTGCNHRGRQPHVHQGAFGFGPLFAQLSLQEIGSAAIMSRAAAGLIGSTVVFCMPGSLNACKLACTRLIFSELRPPGQTPER